MSEGVTIYALSDPRKPALMRYIGKTKHCVRSRLIQHLSYAKRKVTPKNSWINSLKKHGLKPRIWILEMCSESNWQEREKFWITLFKPLGLLNLTDGGDAGPDMTGYRHSSEAKECIRLSSTGRKRPMAAIEATRTFWTGRKHNAKTLAQMSQSRKGKRLPEIAYQILSKKLKGIPRTATVVEKIRLAIRNSPAFMAWKKKACVPIRCRTTKKQFESINEAARFYGIKKNTLRNAIQRGTRCKKMEWEKCLVLS